tara:strand:+ start:1070 stop:1420 length:351 start_codon:yes stop_codon:yes gene_type:complete
MPNEFKDKHSFEKRREESRRILMKYPDRIPVIILRGSKEVPNIDRQKYLVPNDLAISGLMYVVRKRIKLTPEKSLYFFINDTVMPATSTMVSSMYEDFKDKDGFLYITYCGETTFG